VKLWQPSVWRPVPWFPRSILTAVPHLQLKSGHLAKNTANTHLTRCSTTPPVSCGLGLSVVTPTLINVTSSGWSCTHLGEDGTGGPFAGHLNCGACQDAPLPIDYDVCVGYSGSYDLDLPIPPPSLATGSGTGTPGNGPGVPDATYGFYGGGCSINSSYLIHQCGTAPFVNVSVMVALAYDTSGVTNDYRWTIGFNTIWPGSGALDYWDHYYYISDPLTHTGVPYSGGIVNTAGTFTCHFWYAYAQYSSGGGNNLCNHPANILLHVT
jgi:hypothetical protein